MMTFNVNSKLIKAVKENDQEEVLYCLIDGGNVRQRVSKHGEYLLHIADSAFVVKSLLQFGAKVNAMDSYRRSPLHAAIENRRDLELIIELLKGGANVNSKALSGDGHNTHHGRGLEAHYENLVYGIELSMGNKLRGQLPLHYACRYAPYNLDKQVDLVRALLLHGADVNATDDWGDTALHTAIYEEAHSGVLEVLLENGADITVKGLHPSTSVPKSFTPLDAALRYNDLFKAKEMIRLTLIHKLGHDWRKVIELPQNTLSSKYIELFNYLNECLAEIVRMKSDVISGKNSLYSYMNSKKGGYLKPLYLLNTDFEKEVPIQYPIYFDIIMTRTELCIERAEFLEVMYSIYFPDFEGKGVFQNCYCLRQIADNLSNDDLLNFIFAFK